MTVKISNLLELPPSGIAFCSQNLSGFFDRVKKPEWLSLLLEHCDADFIIAGGVFSSLISDSEINDVDVFFTSEASFLDFYGEIKSNTKLSEMWRSLEDGLFERLCAEESFRYINILPQNTKSPKIQMIKTRWYKGAVDVIDSFDLTCAMVAIEKRGEDIFLTSHPLSLFDIARKKLVLHRLSFPSDTLRRVIKYTKKGFYACPGSLANICKEIGDHPELNKGFFYID